MKMPNFHTGEVRKGDGFLVLLGMIGFWVHPQILSQIRLFISLGTSTLGATNHSYLRRLLLHENISEKLQWREPESLRASGVHFTRGRQINGQTAFLRKTGMSFITKIKLAIKKSSNILNLYNTIPFLDIC